MTDSEVLKKNAEEWLEKAMAELKELPKLSERVSRLSQINNHDWYGHTLSNLTSELSIASGMFAIALKIPGQIAVLTTIPLVAWRARNVLELSVWMLYCVQSRGNAHNFYSDKGRDAIDLFSTFSKLAQSLSYKPGVTLLSEAQVRMHGTATDAGMTGLDDPFTPVRKAAKTLGVEQVFIGYNKYLSKFAHPSALMIMGLPNDESIESFGYVSIVLCIPFYLSAIAELKKILPDT